MTEDSARVNVGLEKVKWVQVRRFSWIATILFGIGAVGVALALFSSSFEDSGGWGFSLEKK